MDQQVNRPENIGPPAAKGVAGMAGLPQELVASVLDPVEQRAWRAFLSRHARVARRLEADLIARTKEQTAGKSDLQLLQSTFARLR